MSDQYDTKKEIIHLALKILQIILILLVLGLVIFTVVKHFQTDNVLTVSDLQDPPSEDKPLHLTPSYLEMVEGQSDRTQLAFFNPSDVNRFWRILVSDANGTDCYSGSTCNELFMIWNNITFKLDKSRVIGYWIIINSSSNLIDKIKDDKNSNEIQMNYHISICAVNNLSSTDCDTNYPESYEREIEIHILDSAYAENQRLELERQYFELNLQSFLEDRVWFFVITLVLLIIFIEIIKHILTKK
jgi:hypothetical protein